MRTKLQSYLSLALLALHVPVFAQVCDPDVQRTAASYNFAIMHDDLVKDNRTGLIWTRCVSGQTWRGDRCLSTSDDPDHGEYTWKEALEYAATSQRGGYTDWRLPNIRELNSIVEYACYGPALDRKIFHFSATVFSSTGVREKEDSSGDVLGLNFHDGDWHSSTRTRHSHVLLVREAE